MQLVLPRSSEERATSPGVFQRAKADAKNFNPAFANSRSLRLVSNLLILFVPTDSRIPYKAAYPIHYYLAVWRHCVRVSTD